MCVCKAFQLLNARRVHNTMCSEVWDFICTAAEKNHIGGELTTHRERANRYKELKKHHISVKVL